MGKGEGIARVLAVAGETRSIGKIHSNLIQSHSEFDSSLGSSKPKENPVKLGMVCAIHLRPVIGMALGSLGPWP